MFKLNNNAYSNMTSLKGYVKIAPSKLVELFGKPIECDGYKVSGEYIFEDKESGEVFTLYDWKSTSLYDNCGGPDPDTFWKSDEVYNFHVGGRTDATKFINELTKLVNRAAINLIAG